MKSDPRQLKNIKVNLRRNFCTVLHKHRHSKNIFCSFLKYIFLINLYFDIILYLDLHKMELGGPILDVQMILNELKMLCFYNKNTHENNFNLPAAIPILTSTSFLNKSKVRTFKNRLFEYLNL